MEQGKVFTELLSENKMSLKSTFWFSTAIWWHDRCKLTLVFQTVNTIHVPSKHFFIGNLECIKMFRLRIDAKFRCNKKNEDFFLQSVISKLFFFLQPRERELNL